MLVQVREYYEKDGAWLPGKKGVALAPDALRALADAAGAISAALPAAAFEAKPARAATTAAAAAPAAAAGPAAAAAQQAGGASGAAAGASSGGEGGGSFVDLGGRKRASVNVFKGAKVRRVRSMLCAPAWRQEGQRRASASLCTPAATVSPLNQPTTTQSQTHAHKPTNKQQYVDLREYYEKGGELLPGKKGISIPGAEWDAVKSAMAAATAAAEARDLSFSVKLGAK